jgi:transposase
MGIATEDIRQRAIQAYQAGEGSQAKIAAIYRVALRTFARWWRQYQQRGTCTPAKRGHRKAAFEGQDLQALDHAISRQPDATLEQLLRQSGIVCSIMAVHRAALRLDWHYKKSRCGRVSKTGPT